MACAVNAVLIDLILSDDMVKQLVRIDLFGADHLRVLKLPERAVCLGHAAGESRSHGDES